MYIYKNINIIHLCCGKKCCIICDAEKGTCSKRTKPPLEHKGRKRPVLTERCVCESELASEHEQMNRAYSVVCEPYDYQYERNDAFLSQKAPLSMNTLTTPVVVCEPYDEKVLKCEQNLSFVTATVYIQYYCIYNASAVALGAASAMLNKAPAASELTPPLEDRETE